MRAKVLKIDKSLFDDEVIKIVIPGEIGELCILPHHMPIITSLKKGQIRIFTTKVDRPTVINVDGGVFSFSNDVATVMM